VILADHQIRELCQDEGMVAPFNEELLNPASLDVTLGRLLLIEVEHSFALQPMDISHHTEADPYLLAPGEFVLAQTFEFFKIPKDVSAQFVLKSSRARDGLEHLMAGFLDPGFHGSVLTLELLNARRFHSVPVWPGMRIGQLVFCLMLDEPERCYAATGRYNNDKCVMASKG